MRAFIAVDVQGDEIEKLQQEMMSASSSSSSATTLSSFKKWSPREVKPVERSNFHFTLIFLGEITDWQAEKVKERLASIRFEPFSIIFRGVGAFPSPSHAKVIWVGIDDEGAARLEALANNVVSSMKEVGFSPDKPFSPHLTIFRVKGRPFAIDVSRYAGRNFGTCIVDSIHLKKSDLTSSGPIYSNIYTLSASHQGKSEE
jgi:2'-5' RNA ligase